MLFKEISLFTGRILQNPSVQNAELLVVKAGGTLLPLGFKGLMEESE
jgi:hypothetical protein